jgi:hypothetical protein
VFLSGYGRRFGRAAAFSFISSRRFEMALSYNLENESAVQALLNKQRDLIQKQAELLSRQDAIIGSLVCILNDAQRHGYDKMIIGRSAATIDHLEDELTEV